MCLVLGVNTNRDIWVYNFNRNILAQNMNLTIETYNAEVARWGQRADRNANLDDFVVSDDTKIKWSSGLKQRLQSGQSQNFWTQQSDNRFIDPSQNRTYSLIAL